MSYGISLCLLMPSAWFTSHWWLRWIRWKKYKSFIQFIHFADKLQECYTNCI